MILLWLFACLAPRLTWIEVRPEEAWDVPPPPGQRTVRLVGLARGSWALGEPLTLHGPDGEVLVVGDLVDDDPGVPSLTVYVPEARADALLEARTVGVAR